MRTLIVLLGIALVGAAALSYAWRLAGRLPERTAAAPQAPVAAEASAGESVELARVESRAQVPEPVDDAGSARAPAGLEEGGTAPLLRDYAAIYAGRSVDERRAAIARLSEEILLTRQRLGETELAELAGRTGNAPTTPGVALLLAKLEERAWLVASLAGAPAGVVEDGR